MTNRDSFIDQANQVACQMSAPSPTTTFTDSRTSQSTAIVAESDTLEDELARDEVTPIKRLRPSGMPSVSYNSATGRDSRTASFETPMAISRSPLTPSQNATSRSRIGRASAELNTLGHSAPPLQHGLDTSSMDSPAHLSRQSQSMQDSGRRRQARPVVEVASKRTRYEDEWGWCFEHEGESLFVSDSQWMYREQNRRPALFYARLNVFRYRPSGQLWSFYCTVFCCRSRSISQGGHNVIKSQTA
jgi:hypothetical protein